MKTKLKYWQREIDYCITDYLHTLKHNKGFAVGMAVILIVFIAHPKKLGKDEKIPTMYSISGSSDWYNMADYGIVIHRDANKQPILPWNR